MLPFTGTGLYPYPPAQKFYQTLLQAVYIRIDTGGLYFWLCMSLYTTSRTVSIRDVVKIKFLILKFIG